MNLGTLSLLGALLAMPLAAMSQEARAWPIKPIKIIAPAASGTPSDQLARIVADRLSGTLRQSVLVENRPGAGGIIGMQALIRAAPDGYTLGVIGLTQFVVAPHASEKPPYDLERDFTPLGLVAWNYNLLSVPAGSTMHSIADLVTLAKRKPGLLKLAIGNVAPPRMAFELFKRAADVDLTLIPYKGAPQAVIAALAGEVDMVISAPSVLAPHIRSGKLRALATAAPHRIAAFPDLATFVELGYNSVEVRDGIGFVAPAGIPKDVLARLSREIANVVPITKERLEALGMEPVSLGPGEFAILLREESQRLGALVREVGMKAE